MTDSSSTPSPRLVRACRGERLDRPPVWLMRQAGRYMEEYRAIREKTSFLDLCKNPELAAEVSLQPYKAFGTDAVIMFSDILIPPEAMGMEVVFGDGGPTFPNPIRNAADIERLIIPDPNKQTGFVMDLLKRLKDELKDDPETTLIGFAGAPWTLAVYMVEGGGSRHFARIKGLMYEAPELLEQLLDKLTETVTLYLNAQIEAGAQAVQLFDTWAGILSADEYRRFILPYHQRIINGLNRDKAPVILYVNNSRGLLPMMVEAKPDVISVDSMTSLKEAREIVGPDIALQGNLDPILLLGDSDVLDKHVQSILKEGGNEGFIFNLGHGILPPTPPENVRLVVTRVKESAALYWGQDKKDDEKASKEKSSDSKEQAPKPEQQQEQKQPQAQDQQANQPEQKNQPSDQSQQKQDSQQDEQAQNQPVKAQESEQKPQEQQNNSPQSSEQNQQQPQQQQGQEQQASPFEEAAKAPDYHPSEQQEEKHEQHQQKTQESTAQAPQQQAPAQNQQPQQQAQQQPAAQQNNQPQPQQNQQAPQQPAEPVNESESMRAQYLPVAAEQATEEQNKEPQKTATQQNQQAAPQQNQPAQQNQQQPVAQQQQNQAQPAPQQNQTPAPQQEQPKLQSQEMPVGQQQAMQQGQQAPQPAQSQGQQAPAQPAKEDEKLRSQYVPQTEGQDFQAPRPQTQSSQESTMSRPVEAVEPVSAIERVM